ncbi:uncharacterized protein BDR25DRAFT_117060 [Lindgomyces ingoldianus]|uniref:Uncharacterized protein n=1 Tax=Lindgomyces ingoldianus TaxID=673940 RepID=A0ACB6Q7U1_9PLEO|nr:uncharacterized protein BDR25DRAFT_117060 [Lindgomyces ingoldianus]KAF2463003.1 hypothetical protein BDR25DRAFT_117060 [Lindgomyces ingoldianus]
MCTNSATSFFYILSMFLLVIATSSVGSTWEHSPIADCHFCNLHQPQHLSTIPPSQPPPRKCTSPAQKRLTRVQ